MKINIVPIILVMTLSVCSIIRSSAQQKKQWTLRECVKYATDHNISIQQSQLNIEESELAKESAKGNFLPSVNASATNAWNIGLAPDPVSGQNQRATKMNTSIGANVQLDLFTGLKNQRLLDRAKLSIISSQYQLDDMKDNISLNVANSFLGILFNQESLRVLHTQKEITKSEIERTNELILAGIVPKGDIYAIEASLADIEQRIVNTENDVNLSKINLGQMLLLEDYLSFDIAYDSVELDTSSKALQANAQEIIDYAAITRNNIKMREANIEVAEQELAVSRTGYSPTLAAFYNIDTRASDALPDGYGTQFNDNLGHRFGLTLRIPIFNKYQNDINIQRNKLNVERAKLSYEQTKIELESSVNQAINDAHGAIKAYHAAERTAFARKEAFRYAEERFNAGAINSFEYQQTKQQMENADSQVIRSKYDCIFKIKILEFYFGIPLSD